MMSDKYLFIVDDEDYIRNALERELRHWARDTGMIIKTFESPSEVLDAVKEYGDSVWIIISDQRMPFMDGLTLIGLIHETSPWIPLILLTGNINIESIEASNHPGLFSVLEKPWEHEALIDLLGQASRLRETVRS